MGDEQLELDVLGALALDDVDELLPAGGLDEAEAELGRLDALVDGQHDVLLVLLGDEREDLGDGLVLDLLHLEQVELLADGHDADVLQDEREVGESLEVLLDVAAQLVLADADDLLGLSGDGASGDVVGNDSLASAPAEAASESASESEATSEAESTVASPAESESVRVAESESPRSSEAKTSEAEASPADAAAEPGISFLGQEHGAQADEDEFGVHSGWIVVDSLLLF